MNMKYLRICQDCGEQFKSNGRNAKFCPRCKEKEEELKKLERQANQEKQRIARAIQRHRRLYGDNQHEITLVELEARAHGKSYGFYTSPGAQL